MKPALKYLWLTIKHKWFVFAAGFKLKVPIWRLLKHDLSKFLPSELPHYGRYFFGKADDSIGFISCCIKHQNRNDHHWEYYIPKTGYSRYTPPYLDNELIHMPDGAIKEMVADWVGACRTHKGRWPTKDNWLWRDKNLENIMTRLHPDTKDKLLKMLTKI